MKTLAPILCVLLMGCSTQVSHVTPLPPRWGVTGLAGGALGMISPEGGGTGASEWHGPIILAGPEPGPFPRPMYRDCTCIPPATNHAQFQVAPPATSDFIYLPSHLLIDDLIPRFLPSPETNTIRVRIIGKDADLK